MTNEQLLDLYKNYLIEHRKDDKTIKAYISDMKQFIKYIDRPITDIKNIDIENYKFHMINVLEYRPTTINRKLVALDMFLKINEMSLIVLKQKVQLQNFLDNVLSSKEIDMIIDKAMNNNDYRFITYIQTLKYLGVRAFEALNLKLIDINKDTIFIIGKGKKYRQIFVPDKLRMIWNEYVNKYRVNTSEYLFNGQRGRCVKSTFSKGIIKYGTMANIERDKLHLHSIRHQYCKSMADKNLSIEVIADLAGHSDVNVTRRYMAKSKKELLDIINTL